MPEAQPTAILTFEGARHIVEEHASQLRASGRELLSLLDAAARVLAEPIRADRDFPPFPRATRDGYAVRAEDVRNAPVFLEVTAELKAGGDSSRLRVETGQAIAIMTGAAVPQGADSVVMLEYTSRQGTRVQVERSVGAGDNIVARGAEAKSGDLMLAPGTRIDHAAIAIAASVGRSRVVVHAKPRVAVLSTGDEVVDIDIPPEPHQIRNSNSYSLAAQIQLAGGDPVLLPIAPDEAGRLAELLREGLECELLLVTGGVSMGKYDLVEQVLSELNAEFVFTAAQIQPGKPVVFGRVPCGRHAVRSSAEAPGEAHRGESQTRVGESEPDAGASGSQATQGRYFFGLPGNPISTMVTFELFARPVLEALAGLASRKLVFTHAKLKSMIRTKTGLKRFLPAVVSGEFENAEVELVHWQGSGDIASIARSNCYLVIPPDREQIERGEWVPVLFR